MAVSDEQNATNGRPPRRSVETAAKLARVRKRIGLSITGLLRLSHVLPVVLESDLPPFINRPSPIWFDKAGRLATAARRLRCESYTISNQ